MDTTVCKYDTTRPLEWAWPPGQSHTSRCGLLRGLLRDQLGWRARLRTGAGGKAGRAGRCAGPLSVGQQWRAGSQSRMCWGCCLCLRFLGSSESVPAPTSGHPQVPARAAGGRLGLPGRHPRSEPVSALLLQGTAPGSAKGPPNPGGGRRPRTSASGPGSGLCLWGRCTPRPPWLLCCTSVCRCGTAVGGGALGLNLPRGRYGTKNKTPLPVRL
jgi:hypothetical protein